MTLQFWFWIIYVISLVFGWWIYRVPAQPYPWERFGFHFVMWILIGILGWATFGSPVK